MPRAFNSVGKEMIVNGRKPASQEGVVTLAAEEPLASLTPACSMHAQHQ